MNLIVSDKERTVIEESAPGKPVIVIPIFFYERFPKIIDFAKRRELLFVGGFGHVPNADAVLWFAREILPRFPGVKLIVVGSKPPREVLDLQSDTVDIKGYVSDEVLNKLYAACRIAVIPLRFGAGAKGKTVEAAYNLIPIVSTSFGIEGLPEAEAIMPPCDDAESFSKELERLLASDEACMQAAKAYRQWIDKWFSKKRAEALMREIMEGAKDFASGFSGILL